MCAQVNSQDIDALYTTRTISDRAQHKHWWHTLVPGCSAGVLPDMAGTGALAAVVSADAAVGAGMSPEMVAAVSADAAILVCRSEDVLEAGPGSRLGILSPGVADT